jgi:hypothetical protein
MKKVNGFIAEYPKEDSKITRYGVGIKGGEYARFIRNKTEFAFDHYLLFAMEEPSSLVGINLWNFKIAGISHTPEEAEEAAYLNAKNDLIQKVENSLLPYVEVSEFEDKTDRGKSLERDVKPSEKFPIAHSGPQP